MTQNAINSKNPVIQTVSTSIATLVTCNTTVPIDNSIPQQTEGDEVLTLSITPTKTTSILEIIFSGSISCDATATTIVSALFQDAGLDALSSKAIVCGASGSTVGTLVYYKAAGTTSSTTFKIRVGPNASVAYVNGDAAGGVLFGGVASTTLSITEYQA